MKLSVNIMPLKTIPSGYSQCHQHWWTVARWHISEKCAGLLTY